MPELCARYEDSSDDDSSYCSIPTFLVEDEKNDISMESKQSRENFTNTNKN